MIIAYRFEVQHSFGVVIEDDSDDPINIEEARQKVVENLREYIEASDIGNCCISDGVKL